MSQVTLQQKLESGILRHRRGEIAEAAGIYSEILQAHPDNADAWHLSGLIAFQQKRFDQAESCISRALDIHPQQNDFQSNLASVMLATSREAEAEKVCRDILEQNPRHAGAWKRLGTALSRQGQQAEAVDALTRAVELQPTDASALCNLGAILTDMRKVREARTVLIRAIEHEPRSMEAHLNLGSAERELGNHAAALHHLNAAIDLNSNTAECYVNRGNVHMDQGNVFEALQDFQQAVSLNPRLATAVNGLGRALQVLGKWQEAQEAFDLACMLDAPDLRFESNRLYCASLSPILTRDQLFQLHRTWGQKLEQQTPTLPKVRRENSAPWRIGYLSPDFYSHATMRFFVPLIEHHDRSRFEIICYSESCTDDHITQRVRQNCNHWRSTAGMSDEAVAQLVRDDEVDIAIDLAGHTAGNRLGALAYQPAPVQASFLGYPTTTGLSRIDYFLTDAVRESSVTESYFTEKLVYLPHGACCFEIADSSIPVADLPAITNGHVTFGATHRLEKLSPACLELWARILEKVTTSRLFIFRDVLRSEAVRSTLQQHLVAAGIPLDRVDMAWELPDCHLQIYHNIDILLDVFPWGSGTTAYESLWMGVPIPSILGERGGCRATASMLHHTGLPQLVAQTPGDYVRLVTELASDTEQLATLRSSVRQKMQVSVCDGKQFACDIEAALVQMWNDRHPVESEPQSQSGGA